MLSPILELFPTDKGFGKSPTRIIYTVIEPSIHQKVKDQKNGKMEEGTKVNCSYRA